MTTHPEDAMTRERALEEAARVADAVAAEDQARVRDREVDPGYGTMAVLSAKDIAARIRALASTRQEPAPAADAVTDEMVRKFWIAFHECTMHHPNPASLPDYAVRKGLIAALRRYAGDGGVTNEMVEAACKAYESVTEEMRGIDPKDMRTALEAAARAKSSEKGGA